MSMYRRADRLYIWTAAIACVHVVVACFLAANLNAWVDEFCTLATTGKTVMHAWGQAITFEAQPPGYFVILALWRKLGDSVFWARLLSIGFTAASILLAALISRQYTGHRALPVALPLLVAAQPVTMLAAVEMRRYALALLMTCCLLVLFHQAFIRRGKTLPGWWGLYVLAAVVALYTDFVTAFVLAAQSVVLLSKRSYREFGAQASSLVLVLVLLGPIVPEIISQIETYEGLQSPSTSQLETGLRVTSYALDNVVATRWLGRWNRPAKFLIAVVAVLSALYVARRSVRDRTVTPPLDPIIMATALGASLIVVASVAPSAFSHPKHFIAMLIPWNLALVSALTAFRRTTVVVVITAIAAVNCLASAYDYRQLAKRGDCWRVARFIEQNERPGEPIIVFTGEAAVGIKYYYTGLNRIVAVPKPFDLSGGSYNVRELALEDECEFWQSLGERSDDRGYFWVVTDSSTDPGSGSCRYGAIDFNCALFERILSDKFVLLENTDFFEARVRYYRLQDLADNLDNATR